MVETSNTGLCQHVEVCKHINSENFQPRRFISASDIKKMFITPLTGTDPPEITHYTIQLRIKEVQFPHQINSTQEKCNIILSTQKYWCIMVHDDGRNENPPRVSPIKTIVNQ